MTPVGTSAIPPGLSDVHLVRRSGPIPGAPILIDDNGDAVLTLEPAGRGRHYRLATRADPAWSDLALGSALPELAVFLLSRGAHPADDAPVSATQAAPRRRRGPDRIESRTTSLRAAALWLAGGLLLVERLLAHRRRSPA